MPVTRRLIAAVTATALAVPLLGACGAEQPAKNSRGIYALDAAGAARPAQAEGPAPTRAATYSGELTGRFVDYAYQRISAASMVLNAKGTQGGKSPKDFALGGLDIADERLADLLAEGGEGGEGKSDAAELRTALRTTSAALLDWAEATAKGERKEAEAARGRLERGAGPVAEAAAPFTPGVSRDRLAAAFAGVDSAVLDYLAKVGARSPEAQPAIRVPAARAYALARAIAPGSARERGYAGDLGEPGQAAFAALNHLMVEHFWLTNNYVVLMVSRKGEVADPAVAAGAGMLDDNSRALMALLTEDQKTERRLLTAWRIHVDLFMAYTRAGMNGDRAGQQRARARLDRFRHTQARLLAGALPGTSAEVIAAGLAHHVSSALQTADAFRGNDPRTLRMLFDSSAHMAHLTDALVRSPVLARTGRA